MFRAMPPHLMALVVLLIVVVWFMLVHQFRRSPGLQRFISEAIGEDTPEHALLAFNAAKSRLAKHLDGNQLDADMRQRIEAALEKNQQPRTSGFPA